MKKAPKDRFAVSVKVGPKGQITVPKEAREMFDINEGDTLMVLGDKNRGMAILKCDSLYDVMGGILDGGNKNS
ncbi:MAG: AbrB/MazE/SpoVT family DNA-binding domain-containing protein [Clostridia bacterium]|nr:AbrB/MazE/SpoVT family DNA-binding domain-containing protein [Clostridia bacterium]